MRKFAVSLVAICVLGLAAHASAVDAPIPKYSKMVDISRLVEANMPADPAIKLPVMDFFGTIKGGGSHNLEVISYCPHTGTHMDAPYHVIDSAGAVETYRPDILIGPAVVVAVGRPGGYEISKKDIELWECENGPIAAGDAVLFHTGHDANWSKGFDAYIGDGYTTVSPGAAEYLAEKKVRYVGVESISPDGDSVSAHTILLKKGIPIVENVCSLGEIGAKRCFTVGTFPAVKGATGVWVRLLAFL